MIAGEWSIAPTDRAAHLFIQRAVKGSYRLKGPERASSIPNRIWNKKKDLQALMGFIRVITMVGTSASKPQWNNIPSLSGFAASFLYDMYILHPCPLSLAYLAKRTCHVMTNLQFFDMPIAINNACHLAIDFSLDLVVDTQKQVERFIQYCIFPRVLNTTVDAFYCAKMIHIMHRIRTPHFGTLIILDRVSVACSPFPLPLDRVRETVSVARSIPN